MSEHTHRNKRIQTHTETLAIALTQTQRLTRTQVSLTNDLGTSYISLDGSNATVATSGVVSSTRSIYHSNGRLLANAGTYRDATRVTLTYSRKRIHAKTHIHTDTNDPAHG